MDSQQRGRSPSAGRQNDISRHTPSPSPHRSYQPGVSGLGLDQSLLSDPNSFNNNFTQFNQPPQGAFDVSGQFGAGNNQQSFQQPSDIANHTFLQAQGLSQGSSPSSFGQQGGDNIYSGNLSDWNSSSRNSANFDAQLYPGSNSNQDLGLNYGGGSLDPKLLDPQSSQDQSITPETLMNQMGTMQQHTPTPPHLLHAPDMQRQHSGSPHASPNLDQGAFLPPGHARQTSLDPSAAFAQQQGAEWGGGMQFRGHRRSPSDTYSDVSSNHPSPYLGNADSFDHVDQPSPLLGAQQDPALFSNVLNFDQFSINEQQRHISPGHTPQMSPNLMPQQQSLPPFTSADNFGLTPQMNNQQYGGPNGMDMFPGQGQEAFPAMHQEGDFGNADAMSPPEINIQLAPPSRQPSFEPAKPEGPVEGGLSPPTRGRRVRAKSDPFSNTSTRASTPQTQPNHSLSPSAAAGRQSRSPSPAGGKSSSRRSSTSSIPNRDYILDLADPSRSPSATSSNGAGGAGSPGESTATGPKRTQKHPATFQCSLCPKRFTRAYNLRSHLRTHTDERPFVCSVCGKAFARQHDRKRHEGLHSGEKKFVCRGVLKEGGQWGCGRRFARADALGRHFRSEAGRVCIKPLLEEEATEKGWEPQDQQQNLDPSAGGMMGQQMMGIPGMPPQGFDPQAQMGYPQPGMDPNAMAAQQQFYLPRALLAQHPALAGIQWDTMPQGGDEDVGGRSSFDASSGGEMFDENEDDFGRPSFGWASDSGF